MNLIKISNNIFINADNICSIEQKLFNKNMRVVVYMIDGNEYEIDAIDVAEFMKEIFSSSSIGPDRFAG